MEKQLFMLRTRKNPLPLIDIYNLVISPYFHNPYNHNMHPIVQANYYVQPRRSKQDLNKSAIYLGIIFTDRGIQVISSVIIIKCLELFIRKKQKVNYIHLRASPTVLKSLARRDRCPISRRNKKETYSASEDSTPSSHISQNFLSL